jgi:hypothetical protein
MWRRLKVWVVGLVWAPPPAPARLITPHVVDRSPDELALLAAQKRAHRLRMRKRQNAHVATQGSVCLH